MNIKIKIMLLVLIASSLTFSAVQMDSKAHSEIVMNKMDGIYLKRHKFMEKLGKRMKAFSNFMKRGDGNPLKLATMAGEIVAESPKIPDLFPEHTGMMENEDSEAKPEIWGN